MAASDIYPLSTQNGQAVPLEVTKPLSLTSWAFVANTAEAITIPDGKVAWVYATEDMILSMHATILPNTLVDATTYPNAMFIPAGIPVVIEITPGTASITGLASGSLYMNIMTQWAALVQARQTTIG